MFKAQFLAHGELQQLINALILDGYHCIGPQVRDGSIVYDSLTEASQLPIGIHDEQQPGTYRLKKSDSKRYFAWANGAQAIKPLTFHPHEPAWEAHRNEQGHIEFREIAQKIPKTALLGVRSCDLAALLIQDKHFLHSEFKDQQYLQRRSHLFLIAVNCTHPADTCFCASTGDGPRATHSYDMVLTENESGFILETRTDHAQRIIEKIPLREATREETDAATASLERAAHNQSRSLPSRNLRDSLFSRLQHPQWAEIAKRCLSCGNCTSVCPTCFCHKETDETRLGGDSTTHYREWDSCFTSMHSYIAGITIRKTTEHRYRQWLTHKLGSWHDQYGVSGCTGCGRCISWCPAGIDLTAEVAILCEGETYV